MILRNLKRTFDAGLLNEVSNHPDVRPWLGGDGPVDWSPYLRRTDSVALVSEHGGWVFHKLAPSLYEIHSQFLVEGRGPQLPALLREALRYMFCVTDCTEVVTKAPESNKGAIGLSRAVGAQEIFQRQNAWPHEGGPASVAYYRLSFDRWKAGDDCVAGAGARFHERLEAAKAEAGVAIHSHAHDEAHDRAVGAAVLMATYGNPQKAIALYNRWAVFVGYAPATLCSEHPVLVDIGEALVGIAGEEVEVLKCHGERQPQ